jgi:ABC-type sugar transport system substrate-binding protein
MKKNALISCAAIFASTLTIAACTTGSETSVDSSGAESAASSPASEKTVAISIYTREIPYYQDMIAGMESAIAERGLDATFSFANSDPERQFSDIENAITKAPDGMIVAPIDKSALIPAMREAVDAGITLVTTGNAIEEASQSIQLAFVGHDHVETGRIKAQYIVDSLDGEGTVAMIHAIRGLDFSESQAKGAREVFDSYPGITVVEQDYTNSFSSDDALALTQNILTRFPKLDALFYDNDDLALGGVLATKERGLAPDEILLIGTDGSPAALESVKAGDMDMTVLLCSYKEGVTAVNVLADYLLKDIKPSQPIIRSTPIVVTTSDIEEIMAGLTRNDC